MKWLKPPGARPPGQAQPAPKPAPHGGPLAASGPVRLRPDPQRPDDPRRTEKGPSAAPRCGKRRWKRPSTDRGHLRLIRHTPRPRTHHGFVEGLSRRCAARHSCAGAISKVDHVHPPPVSDHRCARALRPFSLSRPGPRRRAAGVPEPGRTINGIDPVAYFDGGGPVERQSRGSPMTGMAPRGFSANAANRDAFAVRARALCPRLRGVLRLCRLARVPAPTTSRGMVHRGRSPLPQRKPASRVSSGPPANCRT